MIVPNLLADRSYDIEFNGYLSNHAKHAIVALDNINASEERIGEWWDTYTSLTPYDLELHKVDKTWESVEACTPYQWNEWRGKKIHWQEMCVFMERELKDRFDGDTNKLVSEYAPPLLPGMAGALTHGLIHLGWAIDADSEWMIIEGLAYLNFCNIGVDPSKIAVSMEPTESVTPLETFIEVADTWHKDQLAKTWIESTKNKYGEDFHAELVPAGFQWELAKVLAEPHEIATKVPRWIMDAPIEQVWENLYRSAVLVYLATKDAEGNGNFLILHTITSLWGLEHVLNVIDNDSVTRASFQQYYTMLICLLATSASGIPSSKILAEAACAYPSSSKEEVDWEPIEVRGMAEEEEHNIKLVYVCRELWKRYGHWTGFSEAARSFTLTPNIGPATVSFKA